MEILVSKALTQSLASSSKAHDLLSLPEVMNDYYRLKAAEWGAAAERETGSPLITC